MKVSELQENPTSALLVGLAWRKVQLTTSCRTNTVQVGIVQNYIAVVIENFKQEETTGWSAEDNFTITDIGDSNHDRRL